MRRENCHDLLRGIDRGDLPTVNVSGEIELEINEVCHLAVRQCRYRYPNHTGTLYITSKRVYFQGDDHRGINWPVKSMVGCFVENLYVMIVLNDSLDDYHTLTTGDPICDSLVATVVQKLISRSRAEGNPQGRTENQTGQSRATRSQGKVKWFNNEKGYGFIGAQNGIEVFVHYSMISADGFKTLQDGDLVEFEIVPGTRGPMASSVTRVGVPTKDMARIRGVAKWFKDSDGYGVIGSHEVPDLFVHYSAIMMNGHKSLREGDLVELSIVNGVNGPMAARVVRLAEAKTGPRAKETETHRQPDLGKAPDQSAWDVLGVQRDSSLGEITTAYHRMAQLYHPDKVAGLGPEFRELAEKRMTKINLAYQELKRQL